MKRRVVVFTSLFALHASLSLGQPLLEFTAEALVARGLTPAGLVIVHGVAREPQGFHTRVARRSEVLIADGAGELRYELEEGLALNSVWLVADLTSGGYALATPGGSAFVEAPLPANAIRASATDDSDELVSDLGFVEVFLLRAPVGAWAGAVGDGGESDRDAKADGSLAASLGALEPIGETVELSLGRALLGDVLLVVDPRRMRYYAAELGGKGR